MNQGEDVQVTGNVVIDLEGVNKWFMRAPPETA